MVKKKKRKNVQSILWILDIVCGPQSLVVVGGLVAWDPTNCSPVVSSVHHKYRSGMPFLPPGDLNPGIKLKSPSLKTVPPILNTLPPPSPLYPLDRIVPQHRLWVPCFMHQTCAGDLFHI